MVTFIVSNRHDKYMQRRGLGSGLAIAVICGAAVWLTWVVWQSNDRVGMATFGAYAVALAVAAVSVSGWVWRFRVRRAGSSTEELEFDRLLDLLAMAVKIQWTDAARERGLLGALQSLVHWNQPDAALAGPLVAALESRRFPPLPGCERVGLARMLKGDTGELHDIYAGLGSGRLVITGAAGSG